MTGSKKGFRTYFVKNGVRYDAKDYGYQAWPFGSSSKHRAKKGRRRSLPGKKRGQP